MDWEVAGDWMRKTSWPCQQRVGVGVGPRLLSEPSWGVPRGAPMFPLFVHHFRGGPNPLLARYVVYSPWLT